VPYGVLQCIRGAKSFITRRVADNRGLKGVSAGAAQCKPYLSMKFRQHRQAVVTGKSKFYEFADISQSESTNS
jgi:hypothetical protein